MDLPTEDYLAIEPSLRSLAASRNITNYGDSRFAVAAFGVIGSDNQVVSGSNMMRVSSVTLTNDQIKALPTTKQLVVSGIVGRLIFPWSWIVVLNSSGGSYTADLNASWILESGIGNAYRSSLIFPAGMLNAAAGIYFLPSVGPLLEVPNGSFFPDFVGLVGSSSPNALVSAHTGQGLYIRDDYDGVSDYTGGNSSNTLKVIVYYTAVDVS